MFQTADPGPRKFPGESSLVQILFTLAGAVHFRGALLVFL